MKLGREYILGREQILNNTGILDFENRGGFYVLDQPLTNDTVYKSICVYGSVNESGYITFYIVRNQTIVETGDIIHRRSSLPSCHQFNKVTSVVDFDVILINIPTLCKERQRRMSPLCPLQVNLRSNDSRTKYYGEKLEVCDIISGNVSFNISAVRLNVQLNVDLEEGIVIIL